MKPKGRNKEDTEMTPELFKSLREVKGMIESQIKNDVLNGRKPRDTVETLFNNLDEDTVKWFFAETVKAEEWDGRFSRYTKEWAKQLYVPALHGEDGKRYGQISDSIVHHAHIDQLINEIIKVGRNEQC
jgi:hypothetical protein